MAAIFTQDLFDFLQDLADHNDRDWFQANKHRYEGDVREPARELIREMGPRVANISPHLRTDDRKMGGSLMRVYRDTRFAKDKTPYKTNVGIQFRHEAGKDVHAPGLYIHIALDELFLGCGTWRPPSDALAKIRAAIDEHPERWTALNEEAGFVSAWRPMGTSLKRAPKGYPKDHPFIDEIKRKDFIAGADFTRDELLSADFPALLEARFKLGAPYCAFLCEALGVPF